MTEAERELLLALASLAFKLAHDSGRVADAEEIRLACEAVETEKRNR